MDAPNMEEVTFEEIETNGQSQEPSTEPTTEASNEPSSNPPAEPSSIDPEEIRVLSRYAQNAAQQNQLLQQQLLEMRQQLAGVSERVTPTTPKAPIITDDEIRESPAAAMERLFEAKLEEKLSRTMAPLIEAQRAQQREAQFQQAFVPVVSALRPELAQYADALAPAVKQLLGTADPTPQNIQMATVMAIGNYAIQGGLPTSAPSQPAPTTMGRPNVPASAPSSSPRSRPAKVALTETERRAMARLGYKEGQEAKFKAMIEADEVSF